MPNILVIDGSPFWRDLAADGLRLKGHAVSAAEDVPAGLAMLKRKGADLIILEAQLSGVNGLLFIEQLRAMPQWKNVPIIILTSEIQKDQILRARQLGVVDYVLKTQFSLRDLIERVDRRLDPKAAANPSTPEPAASPGAPKQMLTRDQCLARAVERLVVELYPV